MTLQRRNAFKHSFNVTICRNHRMNARIPNIGLVRGLHTSGRSDASYRIKTERPWGSVSLWVQAIRSQPVDGEQRPDPPPWPGIADRADGAAAARRELDQAWAVSQGGRRPDYDKDLAARRPYPHRGPRRRSGHDGRAVREAFGGGIGLEQRQRAAAHDLRRRFRLKLTSRPGAARRSAWRSPSSTSP